MAFVPIAPASFHCKCIEPPRPPQKPSSKPQISERLFLKTVTTSAEKSLLGSNPFGAIKPRVLAKN